MLIDLLKLLVVNSWISVLSGLLIGAAKSVPVLPVIGSTMIALIFGELILVITIVLFKWVES